MTEEQIINAAVERALLMIPEVLETLIYKKVTTKKAVTKFFEDNKDFSGHLNFVQEIIEKTETDNPGFSYEKVLEIATPEIKKKLSTLSGLETKTVTRPTSLFFDRDNGEL